GRAHQWTRAPGAVPSWFSGGGGVVFPGWIGEGWALFPPASFCGGWGVRCWVSEGATCGVGSCVPPRVTHAVPGRPEWAVLGGVGVSCWGSEGATCVVGSCVPPPVTHAFPGRAVWAVLGGVRWGRVWCVFGFVDSVREHVVICSGQVNVAYGGCLGTRPR